MHGATPTPQVPAGAIHGAERLPSVVVDSYNIEAKDEEGFVGDRATRGAFRELLEKWRKVLRKSGDDPLGDNESDDIGKKKLDQLLLQGNPLAAAIIHAAIEEFAQELAAVIKRFIKKLKAWRETQRIVVGGGFRASRAGELAICRASLLLKAEDIRVDLIPVRFDPDQAGLLGAVHLVPRWMFEGHDAILAVDIGGSNIRAGIVKLNLPKATDLSKAEVWKFDVWAHAEEKQVGRDDVVEKLVDMLQKLIQRAQKEKLRLVPFIGVGCPGVISPDGSIERGGQNLPGKWEGKFNLPQALLNAIPRLNKYDTTIVMHNDAVVQGLSERPFMNDVTQWGVLTIGTGLGNAQFTNRSDDED